MRREAETAAILHAWTPDREWAARDFDDAHLLDYRHPNEVRSLLLALAIVIAAIGVALYVQPAIAAAVVVVWLVLVVDIWLRVSRQVANAGEITPTQFAHLYPLVAELRERFALPYTRVFIAQSPVLNAYAFGYRTPYIIVIHSALVDAMDLLELKAVIAHEMGHIRFGHTRLAVLLGGLELGKQDLPFPLSIISGVRQYIFHWWGRCQELTADRAGVVGSGRPSKMVSALVKLGVGPTMYQHVNIDDLARQSESLRRGWWRVSGFISQLDVDHPFMVNRIRAVVDFVGHPAGGAGPTPAAPGGSPPPGPAGPLESSPRAPAGAVEPAPPAPASPVEPSPPAPAGPVEPSPSPAIVPVLRLAGVAPAGESAARAPRAEAPPAAPPAAPAVSPPLPAAIVVPPPPAPIVVPPPPAPIAVPPPPAPIAVPPPTAPRAAPRPPATRPGGMLAVRTGPDAGRSYILDERPRTLGRGSDCDLRWEDSSLSRRHCRIRWDDGVYVLEDLDSSNGTYINGAVVRRAILRLGDRIQLGGLELEFTPPAARDR